MPPLNPPQTAPTPPPKEDTYVYIDGFNFYYGAVKKRRPGYKWLNLQEWCQKVLPQSNILKIKYFTAKVTGKYDQGKPVRQEIYWRALRTLPNLEIIEGAFLSKRKMIYITPDISLMANIFEEKGTDVNLASHLVNDAHLKKFKTAVVVSNDSDLADPIRIATQELKLKVGVVNPHNRINKQINQYAAFTKRVRDGQITSSQFPATLTDAVGTFTRPLGW